MESFHIIFGVFILSVFSDIEGISDELFEDNLTTSTVSDIFSEPQIPAEGLLLPSWKYHEQIPEIRYPRIFSMKKVTVQPIKTIPLSSTITTSTTSTTMPSTTTTTTSSTTTTMPLPNIAAVSNHQSINDEFVRQSMHQPVHYTRQITADDPVTVMLRYAFERFLDQLKQDESFKQLLRRITLPVPIYDYGRIRNIDDVTYDDFSGVHQDISEFKNPTAFEAAHWQLQPIYTLNNAFPDVITPSSIYETTQVFEKVETPTMSTANSASLLSFVPQNETQNFLSSLPVNTVENRLYIDERFYDAKLSKLLDFISIVLKYSRSEHRPLLIVIK